MKKIKISFVIFCVATLVLVKTNCVQGTEDEYEDDHEDNVVEHPGPTFPSVEFEVEEKSVTESSISADESVNESADEDVIQTTTYPVFDDEPLSSTTTQGTTLPPTSTTPGATTTPLYLATIATAGQSTNSITTSTTSTVTPAATTTEGTLSSSTESAVPFLPPHQRPVRSDLASMPTPKGHEIVLGNLTIYESPVSNETFEGVMLISVHDIFGFHPHVKYISDRLSEFGLRTVIPDFFHGKPVAIENFPPPNFTDTAKYLFSKEGFWLPVRADLLNTMNYYRSVANVTSFGLYGFCWGAKMIVYASSDTTDFSGINAIGFVHPSRVTTADANNINAPAILLPSNAEADMIPFFQILQQRFGEGESEHYRYDDMRHGFAGATSDFSNPDVRKRVEDVIEKLGTYFRKHLV